MTTALVASVLTPIVAVAALSFSVGIFGMDFARLAAVVGVDALYVPAIALISLFLNEVLGQAAILGVLAIVLALNYPSTGGSVPESMLPPFWQAIHAVWVGSGALETFRSLIFFGGNGFGWPFVRLLILGRYCRDCLGRRLGRQDTSTYGESRQDTLCPRSYRFHLRS